MFINLKYLWF